MTHVTTPKDLIAFLETKLASEIGPHETQEELESGKAILLDVRSLESWQKGYGTGALHIPRRELEKRLGELPRDQTIITYCSDIGCQASLKAQLTLIKAGFNCKHMIGGYKLWSDKGYPTVVPSPRLVTPKAPGTSAKK